MAEALLGPVLSDVLAVSEGKKFTLASGFYSETRLDATTISAKSADFLVRLDLNSIDAWVARAIAPDALLRLWQRHPKVSINVHCSPGAHAKIYAGDGEFLIGSANFTVRGLSGTTDEVLWRERDPARRKKMMATLNECKTHMHPLTRAELEEYVDKNIVKVTKLQKRAAKSEEDSLPPAVRRPARIGTYEDYLSWLAQSDSPAATVILARAHGQGQLSGHIRMNFYGIRQFLLAHPAQTTSLRATAPDIYRLCDDGPMEAAIKRFVDREAIDEGGLNVNTWRTYLPERSGGKPKSGGGTSGNLNRMLPLVAAYLKHIAR